MRLFYTLPCIAVLFAGCARQPRTAEIDDAKLRVFKPLPANFTAAETPAVTEQIALGRMLYYDPRLSKDESVSCNSCHPLDRYGVDGRATSDGHKGQKGDRNAPTVYNAAGHMAQFWDGRAADVEAQAKGPVLNPVEMAMASDREVVAVLRSIPGYVESFHRAFPQDKQPVTFDNMARAIGAFERNLVTPSRWDKFLNGDRTALTAAEEAGLQEFLAAGCQTCHAGALVGGNLYQRIGAAKPYPDTSDPGRFKVTQSEADRMMFKVPSLRNIEKTGPYFHNGKVPSLEQAVTQMAEYQLGKQLTQAQVNAIVTWLKALTGEIPREYITPPQLPGRSERAHVYNCVRGRAGA